MAGTLRHILLLAAMLIIFFYVTLTDTAGDEKKQMGCIPTWKSVATVLGMTGVAGDEEKQMGCIPTWKSVVAIVAIVSVTIFSALVIFSAAGFGVGGVFAGSLAATIKGLIGNLADGNVFSALKSLGVNGFGAGGVFAGSLADTIKGLIGNVADGNVFAALKSFRLVCFGSGGVGGGSLATIIQGNIGVVAAVGVIAAGCVLAALLVSSFKIMRTKMEPEKMEIAEKLKLKEIEHEQQQQELERRLHHLENIVTTMAPQNKEETINNIDGRVTELENARGATATTAAAAVATAATSSHQSDNLMDVFGALRRQQMTLQVQGTQLQTRMDGIENITENMRREIAVAAACAVIALMTADAASRKYEDIMQICRGMENNQKVLHNQYSRLCTRLHGVATDVDRLEDLHPGDQHQVYDAENSDEQPMVEVFV